MPKDKFVNPLFAKTTTEPDTEIAPLSSTVPPTDSSTKPATELSTQTAPLSSALWTTQSSTELATYTSTDVHRNRGRQAFEHTHERLTLWVDKKLRRQLKQLSHQYEIAQSTLLDEAIADLINKYTKPR